MAKISLKKDYMDGNVLYGKDLNPNFETIETTINANDEAQSETNASVNETLTQLSSDVSQAKTDISTLQGDVADLETAVLDIPTKTSELENDSGFITNEDIPTKISELENDDNTVKDAEYVHTDNNYTDEDKTKLTNMTEYKLPVATSSTLGGVMIGPGLNIGSNGSISLGTASATRLGGVKAGDGVQITADGSLNVIGGSSGDGIPTLTGTQEEPILLYNFTVGDNKVPIGLAYISGYTKETNDSDVNDNFDGYLLYTNPAAIQLIGPAYEPSSDDDLANLCFYFRPMQFNTSPGYLTKPFIKYEANYTITNTEQGYVTPKAVYDYVGALASLNTTDKSSIVNAINELVNSAGTPGEDGATFMPDVSEEGVISWTNDKGLPNPDPVNIKGPQGDTGAPGASGTNGVDGLDYLGYSGDVTYTSTTPSVGQTFTTLLSNYTRTPVVGDVHYLYLQQGQTTYLATCKVTNVSGDNVTVSILAFMNIKGATGPAGQDGADGQGVPTGGTEGQVLTKNSDTDYDTVWKTVESGGGQGITVLVGTEDSPIDMRYLVNTGIYRIEGYVTYFPNETHSVVYDNNSAQALNTAQNLGANPILAFINLNKVSETNARCLNMYFREETGDIYLYEKTGNLSKDDNNNFCLTTSTLLTYNYVILRAYSTKQFSVTSYLPTHFAIKSIFATYVGEDKLTNLQTTDKSSLIAAINELNTRLAALENPTE